MPKLLFSNNVQVQKILETRDIDEAPTHRPSPTTTLRELPEFIEDFRMISIETQVMHTWGAGANYKGWIAGYFLPNSYP